MNKRLRAVGVEPPSHAIKSNPLVQQNLIEKLKFYQTRFEIQKKELREVYQELVRVKKRFSDLYDLAPIAYFTLDKDYTIVMVNIIGSELLGMQRSRLLGKIFSRHISRFNLMRRSKSFLALPLPTTVTSPLKIS